MHLLHIEASPRKQRSHSSTIAAAFLVAFRAAHPGARIETLDLWATDLPRFDGDTIDAKYAILAGQPHSAAQAEAWRRVTEVIARFIRPDRLLLSVPMWNFNVPYVLKHYIDIVTQPTFTFSFSPATGYRGLVAGKRVAIIAARSGDYTPGSGNTRPDFQQPFLEAWLRFIGIADIATVAVQPTVASLEKVAAASEAAREQAIAIARAF
jgi:FMN-dependent NADH-azoreductase